MTTSAIETFRRLRGYTVDTTTATPVSPVEETTHTDVDPALIAAPDRAAKSGAVPDLSMPRGVDPTVWQRTYDAVYADTGDEMKAYLAALGQVRRGQYGMATKARKDGQRVLTQAWGIMFGDPKLSDTDHQYFAKDTMFLLDYYPAGVPLFYNHGDDPAYGAMPIGRRVSWSIHEYGIWFVHELDMDHPLINRTLRELDNGELSHSSDSIYHYVVKGLKPDGKLSVWPLAAQSLCKFPAEVGLSAVVPYIETEGELAENVV